LRKPLPKPSPAYGSRFKNDDRQEGAKIKTWKPVFRSNPAAQGVTAKRVTPAPTSFAVTLPP
jgi:hypothetical protein